MRPPPPVECPVSLPGGRGATLFVAPFDAARFTPASFAATGIACPPSVARSVRKRQAEFFFGRLAAGAALRAQGARVLDVAIGAAREPVWPVPFVGSISHADGIAAAVVGHQDRHGGLGLDIEHVASEESEQALRAIAIDARELECLAAAAGTMSLRELVTLAFSAKESLYKGAFGIVGRFFDFSAARVRSVDTVRATLVLVIEEDLHPTFLRGRRCEVAYGRLDATTLWTLFEATEDTAWREAGPRT